MMSISEFKNKLLSSKLINDSFWSIVGNIVGRGLGLIAGIYVARELGKDIYGEYGAIRNTILFMSILSTFGLGYTATKFVADFHRDQEFSKLKSFIAYANKITLIFSGIVAGILLIFSKEFATYVLEASHLADAVKWLSILIIFNAITTTQIGMISGFGKFKELAKINSWVGLFSFLFTVLLVYFYNFEGALFALIISQFINTVMNFLEVRKSLATIKVPSTKDKALYQEIIKYSTPVALQEALYSITSFLMNILLIRYASFSELGLYNAAIQWNSVILFIPGILRNVVLSHFSSHNNNEATHRRILNQTILINVVVTVALSIFVLIFSQWITHFYGKNFSGLNTILILSVFSTIFASVANVYVQAFLSKGMNWSMFMIRLFRDGFSLLLFIALVVFFQFKGAEAMIYAILIMSILSLAIMAYIYKRKENI